MKILFGLAFLLCISVGKIFYSYSICFFLFGLGYENAKEICSVVFRRSLCWRPLSSFSESWGVARHFSHNLIRTFRTNINDFHSRFLTSF